MLVETCDCFLLVSNNRMIPLMEEDGGTLVYEVHKLQHTCNITCTCNNTCACTHTYATHTYMCTYDKTFLEKQFGFSRYKSTESVTHAH